MSTSQPADAGAAPASRIAAMPERAGALIDHIAMEMMRDEHGDHGMLLCGLAALTRGDRPSGDAFGG